MRLLLDMDAFKALLRNLRERQGGKPTSSLLGLAMTLKSIARTKENLGADHVARMARICANYQIDGHIAKSHKRLQAFDDETLLARLLHLPEALLTEAAKSTPRGAKTLAQVAVALEIEWQAPFRLKNLGSLQLGGNIQPVTVHGQRRWLVRFGGDETKNHKSLCFELPAESVLFIERALRFYEHANGYLFPGMKDLHKNLGCLSNQVKMVVEKRLGVPFHMHMMRGLVATLQVKEREGGGFEHARALLGDSTDRIVRKHYTGTAEMHLIRRAQGTIKKSRIRTSPIVRPSRTQKNTV